MPVRQNFTGYIGNTMLYGTISLWVVILVIVLFAHAIDGIFSWGLLISLYLLIPLLFIGSLSGLISTVLNSFVIYALSDHVHRNNRIIQSGTSVTIGLITWGITLPVLQRFEDYATPYGLGDFLLQLMLIGAIIAMIVSHYFALPELFSTSRKVKEKPESQTE